MQEPTGDGEVEASAPVEAANIIPQFQPVVHPPAVSSSSSASVSPMARPATYSGEEGECSGFLLQCELYMEMQASQFTSERAKIAFIISLLTGRALLWARALWDAKGTVTQSFTHFITHFREVFSQASHTLSIHDQLFRLRQGKSSVSDYALQFRTLAASSGWNETALITAFRQGLNPDICLQLAIYDDHIGVEGLIQRSIRVAQQRSACLLDNPAQPPPRPPNIVSPPVPEPMEVDSTHLSSNERQRRILSNLCLYCGAAGHLLISCPVRPPRPAVSSVRLPSPVSSMKHTPVLLTYAKQSVSAKALIDSGAAGNFISLTTLLKLQARRRNNPQILHVQSILGKPLGRGQIRHCSPNITVRIGCLHEEELSFLVLEGSTADIILGRPWLEFHAPNVCWSSGEICQWGSNCFSHCLHTVKKIRLPSTPVPKLSISSTTVESHHQCSS